MALARSGTKNADCLNQDFLAWIKCWPKSEWRDRIRTILLAVNVQTGSLEKVRTGSLEQLKRRVYVKLERVNPSEIAATREDQRPSNDRPQDACPTNYEKPCPLSRKKRHSNLAHTTDTNPVPANEQQDLKGVASAASDPTLEEVAACVMNVERELCKLDAELYAASQLPLSQKGTEVVDALQRSATALFAHANIVLRAVSGKLGVSLGLRQFFEMLLPHIRKNNQYRLYDQFRLVTITKLLLTLCDGTGEHSLEDIIVGHLQDSSKPPVRDGATKIRRVKAGPRSKTRTSGPKGVANRAETEKVLNDEHNQLASVQVMPKPQLSSTSQPQATVQLQAQQQQSVPHVPREDRIPMPLPGPHQTTPAHSAQQYSTHHGIQQPQRAISQQQPGPIIQQQQVQSHTVHHYSAPKVQQQSVQNYQQQRQQSQQQLRQAEPLSSHVGVLQPPPVMQHSQKGIPRQQPDQVTQRQQVQLNYAQPFYMSNQGVQQQSVQDTRQATSTLQPAINKRMQPQPVPHQQAPQRAAHQGVQQSQQRALHSYRAIPHQNMQMQPTQMQSTQMQSTQRLSTQMQSTQMQSTQYPQVQQYAAPIGIQQPQRNPQQFVVSQFYQQTVQGLQQTSNQQLLYAGIPPVQQNAVQQYQSVPTSVISGQNFQTSPQDQQNVANPQLWHNNNNNQVQNQANRAGNANRAPAYHAVPWSNQSYQPTQNPQSYSYQNHLSSAKDTQHSSVTSFHFPQMETLNDNRHSNSVQQLTQVSPVTRSSSRDSGISTPEPAQMNMF